MSRWLLLLLVVLLYFATAASGAGPSDRDRDRLPDRWEKRYGLSISKKSARRDPDHDGLRNLREFRLRTNPRSKDTDGDGLRDGAEVRRYHTNPRRKDTDGDGYSDRVEVLAGTNPRKGDKHPSGSPPPSTPAPGSRPTGSNCMDDPSACGFPDVDNTGPSNPSALMTVNGNVTLSTPGQVYENRLVNGQIIVTAANVTIRNVKIVCRCAPGPIRARPAEGSTNLLVEDVEIDQNGNLFNFGIDGAGYTLRRVKIHNGSDCGATGADTVVEDTFCSLGPDTDGDGWSDNGAAFCDTVDPGPGGDGHPHWDGFQTFTGANQTFRHNTVRNPCRWTSAISVGTNFGGVSDVLVENNLLAGGGYSLYCNGSNTEDSPREYVRGNRFSRRFHPNGGHWGVAHYCNAVDTWTGNVWDENNAPVIG